MKTWVRSSMAPMSLPLRLRRWPSLSVVTVTQLGPSLSMPTWVPVTTTGLPATRRDPRRRLIRLSARGFRGRALSGRATLPA